MLKRHKRDRTLHPTVYDALLCHVETEKSTGVDLVDQSLNQHLCFCVSKVV